MKKTLSILLFAAMLLAVAAPMAFAAVSGSNYDIYRILDLDEPVFVYSDEANKVVDYNNPNWEKIDDISTITLCIDEVLVFVPKDPSVLEEEEITYWNVSPTDLYPVSFVREQLMEDVSDSNLKYVGEDERALYPEDETVGNELMFVYGRDIAYINITVSDKRNDPDADKVTLLSIQEPPEEEPEEDLSIFETYWRDLKWTWINQLHPYMKYCYFTAREWVKGTCATIDTWWYDLWHNDVAVITDP